MSLYRRLEARIQALPGVRAASFSMMTFDEGEWNSPVWPKGLSHTETHAKSFSGNRVGAQYFEALKLQSFGSSLRVAGYAQITVGGHH